MLLYPASRNSSFNHRWVFPIRISRNFMFRPNFSHLLFLFFPFLLTIGCFWLIMWLSRPT
nr:MAG TPA: hypothetical protein [Caudoviricetes sp.]